MRWPPREGELDEGLDTAANPQLPTRAGLKPLPGLWRWSQAFSCSRQPPGANWWPGAENAAVMGRGLCPAVCGPEEESHRLPSRTCCCLFYSAVLPKCVNKPSSAALYTGLWWVLAPSPPLLETSDGGIVRQGTSAAHGPVAALWGRRGRWRVGAFQRTLWAGVWALRSVSSGEEMRGSWSARRQLAALGP